MSTITFQEALVASSTNVFAIVYEFLPRLFGAILVFAIGLILANWTKKLTVRVLHAINLTSLLKQLGVENFLAKAEVKSKVEEIIGTILKWLVLLIFVVASVNILGLPTVSEVLNNILAYIPNIISAVFILAIGMLLAGVIEKLVKGSVAQLDVHVGRLLGKIASYIMMIFAALAAINELGIAKELINTLFIGFVSMMALGFGLAIGLGAKDLVSQILTDWYKKLERDIKKKK
ncbi:hypothetical protein GYA49_05705 [Candidatus Beckwithbacteria bacterium]|nr:hypothetical protein [Candidatus Beckwithbacteria bacterium]